MSVQNGYRAATSNYMYLNPWFILIVIMIIYISFINVQVAGENMTGGRGSGNNQIIYNNNNNAAEILSNTLQTFPDPPQDTEQDLNFRALLCQDTRRSLLPFYRFHLTTRKCYLTGTQGPCGSNMIFVKESYTRAIGKCICDQFIGQHRPLVHHRETNQCYFLYTQGYCEHDEWLMPISGENVNRESNSYWAFCSQNQCIPTLTSNQNLTIEIQNINETNQNLTIEIKNINETNQNSTIQIQNQNQNSTLILNTTHPEIIEPEPEKEKEIVLYNGKCIELKSTPEFCNENEIFDFRNGILNCIVKTIHPSLEIIETQIKIGQSPELKNEHEFDPNPSIQQIPISILTFPTIRTSRAQEENEIATNEFQRRRRSIFDNLFTRWFKCPEGSSLNTLTRECQSFRILPYGFLWDRNNSPYQKQEQDNTLISHL